MGNASRQPLAFADFDPPRQPTRDLTVTIA